jgi:hypothetical protein
MHRLDKHVRTLPFVPLLLLLLAGPATAANLGLIDGAVRDFEGQSRAGIKVELLRRKGGKLDEHLTDQLGRFGFEQVPFGVYQVVATAPDGRREQQEVRVASGEVVTLELFLPIPGQEVVIEVATPKAPLPSKSPASASSLGRAELDDLPRGDSASVNEVLATQPGFVYDAFGNLFARGNHANIQYQLDGVPLPDSVSGLFGGLLSPKLVEDLEVLTGGLGAEYGDRLAAVVNLASRRPTEEGAVTLEVLGGSWQTLSPSLQASKRFGRLSVLAGGSYKTTQRALDPQVFEDLSHAGGDEERGFLKLDYALAEHTHLSALAAFAHDFYRIPIDTSVGPLDPAQPDGGRAPDQYGNAPPPYFPRDTNQTENERDLFALLSLQHAPGPDSSFSASLTWRRSRGLLLGDAAHALGPGQDPCTSDGCPTASDVGRTADHLGLNLRQLLRFGGRHVLEAGLQLDQAFATTDYTAYTRSDALQGPDPALTLAGTDRSRSTNAGLFVQDRATFGSLVINAGLRLDLQRVSFEGSDAPPVQMGLGPRLGVSWSASEATVLHAFAGLLWQPPPLLDTPAAARILGLVPPGEAIRYDLLAEKDRYAEAGVESRVLPQLTLKLTAWGRLSTDQLDDVGVGSTNLVSPYNFREGRAAGVEAGATAVLLDGHLTAFANGTLEHAEGRGIETARYLFESGSLASDDWQTLDHVQTWTANAGATVKDGLTRLSALVGYGSGLRTGPDNAQHVPGHARVDLTLSHEFFSAPARPTVAIDVVNLFDEKYAYRIANGFNGSHYAPGRAVFVRVALGL